MGALSQGDSSVGVCPCTCIGFGRRAKLRRVSPSVRDCHGMSKRREVSEDVFGRLRCINKRWARRTSESVAGRDVESLVRCQH